MNNYNKTADVNTIPSATDYSNSNYQELTKSALGNTQAPEPNLENRANNGTYTSSMEIKKFRDYTQTELEDTGFIITRLSENRDVDDKIVKKKIDSIVSLGGLVQSIIVVPSTSCIREGLGVEIIKSCTTGYEKVSSDDPRLEMMLTIIDGAHRFSAINEINKKIQEENERVENEADKKPLMEAYFKLPLLKDALIKDTLREANIATSTWKSRDYLKHVAATQESCNQGGVFQWISNEIAKNRTGSERALWYFASFSKDRTPSNIKLSIAAKDNDKYKSIVNPTNFKHGTEIYEALKNKFNIDFVRNEAVALYIVDLKDKVIAGNTSTEDFVKQFSTILGKYSKDNPLIKSAIASTEEVEVEDKKGERVTKTVKLKKDERIKKYLSILDRIILKKKPEWYQLIKDNY